MFSYALTPSPEYVQNTTLFHPLEQDISLLYNIPLSMFLPTILRLISKCTEGLRKYRYADYHTNKNVRMQCTFPNIGCSMMPRRMWNKRKNESYAKANFLKGGVCPTFIVGSCSTFLLVPTSLGGDDSGDLEGERLTNGGVKREEVTSGVDARLPVPNSDLSRVTKLLADVVASLWQVAW